MKAVTKVGVGLGLILAFTPRNALAQNNENKFLEQLKKPPIELKLKDKPLAEKPAFAEKKAQNAEMKTVKVNEFTSMTVPSNYEVKYSYSPAPKNAKMEKAAGGVAGIQPENSTILVQTGKQEIVMAAGQETCTYLMDPSKKDNLHNGGKIVYVPQSKKDTCSFGNFYPDAKYQVMIAYYAQNITGDVITALQAFVQSQTGRFVSNVSTAAPPGEIVTKYVFIFKEYLDQQGNPVNEPGGGAWIYAEGIADKSIYPTSDLKSYVYLSSLVSIKDYVDSNNFKTTQSSLSIGGFGLSSGYLIPMVPGIEVQSIITAVEDTPQLPAKYALYQNYPNPFNPATNISFSLPQGANVKLKIYDVLGREIATLENSWLSAGNHTVTWIPPAGTASGVYLYRLEADDPRWSEIRKMMLVK